MSGGPRPCVAGLAWRGLRQGKLDFRAGADRLGPMNESRMYVTRIAAVMLIMAPTGCRKGDEDPQPRGDPSRPVAGNGTNPYGAPDLKGYVPVQPGRQAPGGELPPGNRPAQEGKRDYPVAVRVPGKRGFVFNPYTNGLVDVRGISPGTLVKDPEDPEPTHMFRLPN